MKKIITVATILISSLATQAQTKAPDWTATDCNNVSHTLYDDLDNGKIVVIAWVMPCDYCVNGATAAYNATQQYATSHPGKVVMYLADDLGDSDCSSLAQWVKNNGIGPNMTMCSNAGKAIDQNGFGGIGMPHVAVIAGPDRSIFFNQWNMSANNPAAIKGAIDMGIAATLNIADKTQQFFSISPNPATDNLNITCTKAIGKVTITSLAGQVVKEAVYNGGKMNPVINMDGIAPGTYLVSITDATGKAVINVQKIAKQ